MSTKPPRWCDELKLLMEFEGRLQDIYHKKID